VGRYRVCSDYLIAVHMLQQPSRHRVVERVRSMVAKLVCKGYRVGVEWKGR